MGQRLLSIIVIYFGVVNAFHLDQAVFRSGSSSRTRFVGESVCVSVCRNDQIYQATCLSKIDYIFAPMDDDRPCFLLSLMPSSFTGTSPMGTIQHTKHQSPPTLGSTEKRKTCILSVRFRYGFLPPKISSNSIIALLFFFFLISPSWEKDLNYFIILFSQSSPLQCNCTVL